MTPLPLFLLLREFSRGPEPAPGTGLTYEMDAIAAVVGGTSMSGGSGILVGTIFGPINAGIVNNIQTPPGFDSGIRRIVKDKISSYPSSSMS